MFSITFEAFVHSHVDFVHWRQSIDILYNIFQYGSMTIAWSRRYSTSRMNYFKEFTIDLHMKSLEISKFDCLAYPISMQIYELGISLFGYSKETTRWYVRCSRNFDSSSKSVYLSNDYYKSVLSIDILPITKENSEKRKFRTFNSSIFDFTGCTGVFGWIKALSLISFECSELKIGWKILPKWGCTILLLL